MLLINKINQAIINGDINTIIALIQSEKSPLQSCTNEPVLVRCVKFNSIKLMQILLENGVSINDQNNHADEYRESNTALTEAASLGYMEMVKFLLDKGANINLASESGRTPLTEASNQKHLAIVKLLISCGANLFHTIEVSNIDDEPLENPVYTPLMAAVSANDNDEVVDLLLSHGVELNRYVDSNENFPIKIASISGNAYAVQALLKAGANPNIITRDISIFLEAAENDHDEIVDILISHHQNNNLKICPSILLNAARHSNIYLIDKLIQAGCDVNAIYQKSNALIAAIEENSLKTTQHILNSGAKHLEIEGLKTSPLIAAIQSSYYIFNKERNYADEKKAIIKLIIAIGADINHVVDENSALICSIYSNDEEIFDLLVSHGANVNLLVHDACSGDPDEPYLKNALMVAVNYGLAIPEKLIKLGADMNANSLDGTPLMWAINGRNKENARLLIESGANIHLLDGRGINAFMHAAAIETDELYDLKILPLLVEYGADIDFVNEDGETALDIASRLGIVRNVAIISHYKLMKESLSAVNDLDNEKKNPSVRVRL